MIGVCIVQSGDDPVATIVKLCMSAQLQFKLSHRFCEWQQHSRTNDSRNLLLEQRNKTKFRCATHCHCSGHMESIQIFFDEKVTF